MAPVCQSGNVMMHTIEDSFEHTILPRFVAAGGVPSRLHLIGAMTRADGSEDILLLDRDIPVLRKAIDTIGDVRLLVIDPLNGVLGDTVNENLSGDVRRVLTPLVRMLEETRTAGIGIGHSGKDAANRKGIHKSLGSIAFIAACRTAWAVVNDPDDDSRRLFLSAKNNLGDTDGLAFRLIGTTVEGCDVPLVEWESQPVKTRLDNLASVVKRDKPAFAEAVEWLKANLTEPTLAKSLLTAARRDGIEERGPWQDAKKSLGIVSDRIGTEGNRGRTLALVPAPNPHN